MAKAIQWSAADAVAATGGTASGIWAATGVSIDTRTIEAGDLFVALRGDRLDGHDYVKTALEKGAAAAVVTHRPAGVPEDAPLLIAADTLAALQGLGRAARARTGGKIIAVTGSVGKTGTKEMLAAAFAPLGQVHASKASHNNHWGVPFSLSQMHEGTDYGIFEIGMNHAGEISPLTRQVRPDIAIITTIAPVHMEYFDSELQIADAKAEIFEGVMDGGTVILNRDNEWFGHLQEKALARGLTVRSFGEHAEADARMTACLAAANGTRVTMALAGETYDFTLPVPGRHHALNALAVLLSVSCAGGDVRKAAEALRRFEAVKGRGRRELLDIGDSENPVMLIDESYNASPTSMRAAFKVLALVDPGRGGRRIAILGDMLELGAKAGDYHRDLALPLQAAGVQLVYTCGSLMKNLYNALPPEQQGAHRDTSMELAQIVPDVLVPGDVVMVKGSNGSKMGAVVEALRHLPSSRQTHKGKNGYAV